MAQSILLGIGSSMFYLLGMLLLVVRPKYAPTEQTQLTSLIALIPGVILHAILNYQLLFTAEHELQLGLTNVLTVCGWLSVVGIIVLAVKIPSILSINLIILPLNLIAIVLALIFPSHQQPTSLSLLLEWHIILSSMAYTLLSLAGLLAIMLAVQDHHLRHHQSDTHWLQNLPPLQTLEKLLFNLIWLGFIVLSLALLSGFAFTTDWFNHKILFSCLAWLVFLTLLLGRHFAGWRGQTAIYWTLGGIVFLLLGFLGSKLVLEVILRR